MKKISVLVLSVLVSLFVFTACTSDASDDVTAKPTTVKEDKEHIKASIEQFYSCMEALNDGGFSRVLYDFITKGKEEKRVKGKWCDDTENDEYCYYTNKTVHIERLLDKLEEQFGKSSDVENAFDYTSFKGKYTWNATTKKWTKENSDKIELLFPEYEATKNNCKLLMDTYEDEEVSIEGKTYKLPKKAHILFTVDSKRTAEVTLSDVKYDKSTNITIPTMATVKIFADPFESVLTVKRNTKEEFSVVYKFNIGSSCGYELNNTLTLVHSDYGNIKNTEDFKFLKGYFLQNNLKVTYSVDVDKLNVYKEKDKELTNIEINEPFDVEVHYNGVKIADLEYDKSDKDNPIYFIFKDGSKETTQFYIQGFEKRMRDIFKKFEDLGAHDDEEILIQVKKNK